MLASRFSDRSHVIRSQNPLTDEQIAGVAPSIFAAQAHESRSSRYSYIPTSAVLAKLRHEGFQPFMAIQTRVRVDDRREFAKHMLRLRHANQINDGEACEIILLNSHDGSSSYQMLAGMFRFVCQNGLVCGETVADVRVPHKGNDVAQLVVEGAFQLLDQFPRAAQSRDRMRDVILTEGESVAFARAALAAKYEDLETPAPVAAEQVLSARRWDDRGNDLWSTFNRVQENLMQGGLQARSRTGRRRTTRPVQGIDQSVKLNRALWVLADEMAKLKNA